MPRRAYSYDRVSFGRLDKYDTSSDRTDGTSIKRQDDYAAKRCEREGWFLDEELRFTDKASSGFHRHNESPTADLTRLLRYIDEGTILPGEVVIIEHLDRLTRSEVWDALKLFQRIIDAGVWLATQTPERIYRRDEIGAMELLEPLFIMAAAHDESLKKSERAKWQWSLRRKAAETGGPHGCKPPPWIVWTGERYELHPEKTRIARAIVEMATSGMGAIRILKVLRSRRKEYPPISHSDHWSTGTVYNLLRNEALIGTYQPQSGRPKKPCGPPIRGYYPAALTETEWAQLQASIDHRGHNHGRTSMECSNLFTGLAFFGEVPAAMICSGRYKDGTHIRYLRGWRDEVRTMLVPYPLIEDAILTCVSHLSPTDIVPSSKALTALDGRISELNGRLVKIDQRMSELRAQRRDIDCPTSVVDIEEDLRSLREQRDAAQAELDPLRWERQSSLADRLGSLQSLAEMVRAAKGTETEGELRSRLRGALPTVITRIRLVCQALSNQRVLSHIMIHFKSGEPRYLVVEPKTGVPRGDCIVDLSDPTHPAWTVGHYTGDAAAS